MFVEALIIATCLQGKGGCSESTGAYYKYNNDIQVIAQNVEDFGKKALKGNEWLIYVVSPAYAFASGKQMNFAIHRGWMVGIDVKKESMLLQWSY